MKAISGFILFTYAVFTLVLNSCADDKAGTDTIRTEELAQPQSNKKAFLLNTEQDSISYCLGINMGQHIRTKGIKKLNLVAYAKGIDDVIKDRSLIISHKKSNNIMLDYFEKVRIQNISINMKEGEEFLKKNKTKPGIVTLPSGLQYEILREGSGPNPKYNSKVRIHYHGRFINGKVFDSSVLKQQPVSFELNRPTVIKGWKEAISKMKKGGKWKLYVPSGLAYGAKGYKDIIEPYTTLIFEVELLDIK